ncbi:MAG: phospholipid carrier-dependent glycosyltransferase [Candidatus Elarobacter sp.]
MLARISKPVFVLVALTLGGLIVRLFVARAAGVHDPAGIAGDLLDGVLIWAIVRRIAPGAAAGVTACFAFNPAVIAASAWLGQPDSLSWAIVPAAILAALMPGLADKPIARLALVGAAFVVPVGLFVSTAGGFAYTTVNAFNLYATRGRFWQPDTLAAGSSLLTTATIGIVLFVAAVAVIVGRYRERRDDRSLLEAAMLVALAFFLFPTRVHESGVFGPLLLALPLLAFGGRHAVAAGVLSLTALLNFAYAAAYRSAMTQHLAGADPANLWPAVSHPAAAINVALFFGLGFVYLTVARTDDDPVGAFFARAWFRAHDWFSPREGSAAMDRRDWLLAGGFALAAFAVCVLWVQYPVEKIFDEVYYPRAAEEYLKHIDIGGHGPFEYTHPPLTKLLIAASMLLFGGLNGLGDSTFGWRFLNVVIGALMLPLGYAFTKRVTGSSLAGVLAATLLLADGFRFVQARISTPEITVAVLALAVLYAFYRVWTESATQVRVSRERRTSVRTFAVVLGAGLAVAALAAWLVPSIGPRSVGTEWIAPTRAVCFVYVAIAAYLLARVVAARTAPALATSISFPDGTIVEAAKSGASFALLGGALATGGARDAVRSGPGWTRRFLRDGAEVYDTPAGRARYAPDGSIELDGVAQRPFAPLLWIGLLGLCAGLLLASKWNGILDPLIAVGLGLFVVLQRFMKRPALYGNPFGMRLDLVAAWIVTISGVIYLLSYIPYFALGHNLVDLIEMQNAMYQYHHSLVATHPYASPWWQWPLLLKPISYYYASFAPYKTTLIPSDCCVAEILALPNPLIWWTGLVAVPFVGFLAWKERSRGFLLLAVAYLMQWLPWAASPRIAFEYHFFPNSAIIVICDAILLHRVWLLDLGPGSRLWTRTAVITYVVAALALFAFFYPILAGTHITWEAWRARIWLYPQWI